MQFGYLIFYSICGILIAGSVLQILLKNRRSRQQAKQQSATLQRPTDDSLKASVQTPEAVVSSQSIHYPPPPPPPPKTASSSVLEPEYEQASYAPTASSGIFRSLESTEEEVRLFQQPMQSNWEKAPMPRVLASDIPGVDDSDRTFGPGLNQTFSSLLPETDERRETVRKELMAAGYYNPHAVENLSAIRYMLIMAGIVVFGGLLLIAPRRLEVWAVMGIPAAAILGWAAPVLYVRSKAANRLREISRAMPDLLDMMNMCVSQGLTVQDSLRRVVRDFRGIYPALAQELNIVLEQSQISGLRVALEAFDRRIDLPEVHSFTSLLTQTDRMGTSISESLATYSDTMRESLKQRAEERGNRATFRLLFPTVLCLMPAVYLILLGPAVVEVNRFFKAGGRQSLDTGGAAIRRLNVQRNR